MASKGSNDLNLLLKAQVVRLRAELDVKGSLPRMRKQINEISKLLNSKPVRLKVSLDASIGELNRQMAQLTRRVNSSKTFKPIKMRVDIDVQGSATRIKSQLETINKVVNEFNKNYKYHAKEMKQSSNQMKQAIASTGGVPVAGIGVQNFNNIKQYTEQLKRAREILMSKLPAGQKGIFSSYEMKDMQGNMRGFIATLERSSGVIDKVKYKFNEAKGKFEVVDRVTVTNTERNVQQAMNSLRKLEKELLSTGKEAEKFRSQYNKMMNDGMKGNLTKEAVSDFKILLDNQKKSVENTRNENKLLRERNSLIKQTNATLMKLPQKSQMAQQVRDYKKELLTMPKDAFKTGDAQVNLQKVKSSLAQINAEQKKQESNQTRLNAQREKALRILNNVRNMEREVGTRQSGALTQKNIKEIEYLNKRIMKTKQLGEAQKMIDSMTSKSNAMKAHRDEIVAIDRKEKALRRTEKTIRSYFNVLGSTAETVESRIARMRAEFEKTNASIKRINDTQLMYQKRMERAQEMLGYGSVSNLDANRVKGLINRQDLDGLKQYIGGVEKANIQTANWIKTANGTTKIRAEFEGVGKTVRYMNFELDKAGKAVRVVGEGLTPNRRENLGIWEQMRIAMARVPVWMGAMTVFYGSIRSIRAMSREILELDRVMTEFRRVASDGLNLDYAFQGAINLARELGNDVHGVTQTLADFARTYGEFNERQLLAITKTATLMSNVSDMEVEHAGNTLIAVSNAFGIVADETIRIVDAINEVNISASLYSNV